MESGFEAGGELARALSSTGLLLRHGVFGRDVTTLAIGGLLSHFIEVNSPREVEHVAQCARTLAVPLRVLGGGSNLLVPDAGCPELVLKLGQGFRTTENRGEGKFWVGGASALMSVSRSLSEQGFSGLEFAGGIPASLGGAVWMNAGAHGSEMARIVQSVDLLSKEGTIERLEVGSIPFAYRRSGLPAGSIILGALLSLTAGDAARIMEERARCLRERKERQPLQLPSAGSIFKNPSPELSAGKVLESIGLKGRGIGGAKVSEKHANWIVNPERKATAADVKALIALCQREALERAALELHPELVVW